MNELILHIDRVNPIDFLGIHQSKFQVLKQAFPKLKLVSRGAMIKASGREEELEQFELKFNALILHLERFGELTQADMLGILEAEDDSLNTEEQKAKPTDEIILYGNRGRVIRARTANQKKLVDVSQHHDIVFAVGPAGTGKTYTAVALAVKALKEKTINRIILTRPAVEAGESLGFLPGDLKEKIDPYLRPLYDALDDMIPPDKLRYFMENRIIEVAPLAFMRGRTLDKAFIILDEAQNATIAQLKMFLTRIGPRARCIITGDMTQIDLPKNQRSGLKDAIYRLRSIPEIGLVELSTRDVVRHHLVAKIIRAFDVDKRTDYDQEASSNTTFEEDN